MIKRSNRIRCVAAEVDEHGTRKCAVGGSDVDVSRAAVGVTLH